MEKTKSTILEKIILVENSILNCNYINVLNDYWGVLQIADISRNIPFCRLSHFYNLQILLYVTLNFWRDTLFRSNILKTTKKTLLKKFELLRNANREFLSILSRYF